MPVAQPQYVPTKKITASHPAQIQVTLTMLAATRIGPFHALTCFDSSSKLTLEYKSIHDQLKSLMDSMYAVFYSAEILRISRFVSGIHPNQTYRILMVIIESIKVPMVIPMNPSSLSQSVN